MVEKEKQLDLHERKMAQYTPSDIEKMTEIEVLQCANLRVENEPVPGIILSGTYFKSYEDSTAVAQAVMNRIIKIYESDRESFQKKLEEAEKLNIDQVKILPRLKKYFNLNELIKDEKRILSIIKILWSISAVIILLEAMSELQGLFGSIVMLIFFFGGFILLTSRKKFYE